LLHIEGDSKLSQDASFHLGRLAAMVNWINLDIKHSSELDVLRRLANQKINGLSEHCTFLLACWYIRIAVHCGNLGLQDLKETLANIIEDDTLGCCFSPRDDFDGEYFHLPFGLRTGRPDRTVGVWNRDIVGLDEYLLPFQYPNDPE
jgi:hypothetical protein